MVARLDTAFANSTWLVNFKDPKVTHLPRLSSDHSPILLFHRNFLSHQASSFKFEEMRLHHPSFMEVAKSNWDTPSDGNPQFVLAHKLKFSNRISKGGIERILVTSTRGQLQLNSLTNNYIMPMTRTLM